MKGHRVTGGPSKGTFVNPKKLKGGAFQKQSARNKVRPGKFLRNMGGKKTPLGLSSYSFYRIYGAGISKKKRTVLVFGFRE